MVWVVVSRKVFYNSLGLIALDLAAHCSLHHQTLLNLQCWVSIFQILTLQQQKWVGRFRRLRRENCYKAKSMPHSLIRICWKAGARPTAAFWHITQFGRHFKTILLLDRQSRSLRRYWPSWVLGFWSMDNHYIILKSEWNGGLGTLEWGLKKMDTCCSNVLHCFLLTCIYIWAIGFSFP